MKIAGAEKFWPIRYDPTACLSSVVNVPSFVTSEPLAWMGKTAWPMAQIASG